MPNAVVADTQIQCQPSRHLKVILKVREAIPDTLRPVREPREIERSKYVAEVGAVLRPAQAEQEVREAEEKQPGIETEIANVVLVARHPCPHSKRVAAA